MSRGALDLQDIFPDLPPHLVDSVYKRHKRNPDGAVDELLSIQRTKKPKTVDPVRQLVEMGFSRKQAQAALAQVGGNLSDAVDLLMGENADDSSSASKSQAVAGALPTDEMLFALIHRCEEAVKQAEEKLAEPKVQPPSLAPADEAMLIAIFDEMIAGFNQPQYHRKYGMHPTEVSIFNIKAHDPVPCYFANVQHNSIYYRKVLSMQGLRNLIAGGRAIFMELKAQLFSSDPSKYHPNAGLNHMKMMTGNVVDLDTVVLRCNDPATLKTINEMNKAKGEPLHPSIQHFAQSPQAGLMASEAAKPLLEGFIAEFRLSKAQQKSRRVEVGQLSPHAIPVAYDNASRGKWPLWRYQANGVDTFHVNVPNMADIVGALLKAPVAATRAYLLCRNDPSKLAQFYEDGISDSCFNGKWKALEEFNAVLDKEGSINQILADTQAAHQNVFTAAFFDADDDDASNEIQEMVRLVGQRTGRDKAGAIRPITREDVAQWVKNPNDPI